MSRLRPPRRPPRGFTLIELIVAISVFAILSAMAYGGLQQSLITETRLKAEMAKLERLQMALALIERDLLQGRERGVRDELGDPLPPLQLQLGEGLELTRGGNFSALRKTQGELLRVSYSLSGGTLKRVYWLRLDRTQSTEAVSTELLDKVSELRWRILDARQQWHSNWPSGGEAVQAIAIEVVFKQEDWGEIRRLLPL